MTEQHLSPAEAADYMEGWNKATDPDFKPPSAPGTVSYVERGWDDRLTAISQGRDPGPMDEPPQRRFIGM